ncbi:MAG: zeta toxin family protein [Microcystis aeruginosa]
MSDVYLIAGPNGSGKTTVAKKILPNFLGVIDYVNADEIAAGLSPFNPESVAIQAGRLMLEKLVTLKCQGIDFAFESTLASRNFARFLSDCQSSGYRLNLIYFWLQSPQLALERVHRRVASGGHNIPEDVVRRRYERGRINLMQLYLPLCDTWVVYDNSGDEPHLVAERPFNQQVIIYDSSIWQQITEAAHD